MMTLENDDSVSYNQMLVERNIKVHSTRAPFLSDSGRAHAVYTAKVK